jgi:hypothetical protein
MIRALTSHLLQTTGSLKFLIPFAWLTNLGSYPEWVPAANRMATQIKGPARLVEERERQS